jgi:hypothetical protein
MQATPSTPVEPAVEPALARWLERGGRRLAAAAPLSGDVSPRRYSRLRFAAGDTAILATYPPEVRAVLPRFAATTRLLAAAGVRVPRVLDADDEHGWMLLEDLGSATLADWRGRPWSELGRWFEEGGDVAARIARLPAATVAELNPPLGRELLARELAQTWTLYLEPEGLTGGPALAAALRGTLDELCANLAEEAPVPCHRDLMARNLMPLPVEPSLAVLDHQDLRLGPPAYDLASLLNDTLFPPPELEEEMVAAALPGAEGRRRYHRAAAQRTLKAVGTYVSFARRGAPRHLPLVAPTLGRALGHLARTPETAPLAGDLAALWAPALAG